VLLTKNYSGHKKEMGGPCSMYEELHTGFWCGNLRERGHLEDPGVQGKIILK